MTKKGGLSASDCLYQLWQQVDAYQRYRNIVNAGPPEIARVFAVFSEEKKFLGLVEDRQAALFPGRIFADLLVRSQPDPLSPDMDIETVMQKLKEARREYLPVIQSDGTVLGVLSRYSVFSALIISEQELRGDREKLIEELQIELENRRIAASVFDATSEGILVADLNLKIIMVNRSFTTTTGYTAEEVMGETPRILKSGNHDEPFYKEMWRALTEQGRWEGEIWNRRKSGEIYPEWLHINSIKDEVGNVRYYAGVFSDISYHEDLRAKLLHLAYYDVLTDLPNRKLFMDRLEQAIANTNRTGNNFSLLFIDLDRFKDVNDTLGHRFGDQYLIAVGERLKKAIRDNDTVARFGGDEFIVILQNTYNPGDVAITAEKILTALSATPLSIEGRELYIGASIGVSRYPEDGKDAETLLMSADSAMFRAKEEGKGVIRFFSPEMHNRFVERLEISNALRQSIATGELWLAWQPQVSLIDGKITGAEVLSRWDHKDGRAISPTIFIPIAEETGMITAIGEWVLRSICAVGPEIVECSEKFRIAINFSPLQFHPGAYQSMIEILEATKFNPGSLEIEITESALAARSTGINGFLAKIGKIGVEISVDDFGTGYSNLSNLKNLPINKLKIDKSFVADISTDSNDRQIVAAIINMAHTLGLKVVAEGVETAEQDAILKRLGCDIGQGFYYSHPIPFEQLKKLMTDGLPLPLKKG